MPPKKKSKTKVSDHFCNKCRRTYRMSNQGFSVHYTRYCTGAVTELKIPSKAIGDCHNFEHFHNQAESFGPGRDSAKETDSIIRNRFLVEPSLVEKSARASINSPPEVEDPQFTCNDDNGFDMESDSNIRDLHGAPIIDDDFKHIVYNQENDPVLQMASLSKSYDSMYNDNLVIEPRLVVDEDIEDTNADKVEFDADEWQKYRDKCPESKDWSREYQYNGHLPSYYVALIDLLKILDTHQVDLKVFDSILQWVMHHSLKDPNIWQNNYATPSRQNFISTISKVFRTEHLLPQIKEVELVTGELVSLPYFDFKDMFLSLITDKKLNHPDNMILDDVDKSTWKPTKTIHEWTENDMIDDVNSGTFFHDGLALTDMSTEAPEGIDEVRTVGLQFFIDKSHTDSFGALATTPISFTCWCFNNKCRRQNKFWRQIAFIPNLDIGKGTNKGFDPQREKDKAAGKKVDPKYRTKNNKLKNQHALYRAAFETVVEAVNNGGITAEIDGKIILFKFFVGMIIGDAVGANELCCHYNSCGNANVSCLCVNCHCGFEALINIPPQCQPITRLQITEAMTNVDLGRQISQHPVNSAFNELPLVDAVSGINGICPYENLHVMCNGLFQDVVGIVSNVLGERKTNQSQKDELDHVFRKIATELSRCSERDKPRWTVRFGCLDNTRVTGSERTGILWILSITIYTDWGREIMGPHLKRRGISVKAFVYTITLLLSYDRWTQDTHNRRWELDWAEPALCELMELMQKKLPNPRKIKRKTQVMKKKKMNHVKSAKKKKKKKKVKSSSHAFEKRVKKDDYQGSNGWYKIKYHAMWSIMLQMRKYGSATNFHGGPGEEHHKLNVKKTGANTQRRSTSFSCQVSQRSGESSIIWYAHRHIENLCVPITKKRREETNYDNNKISNELNATNCTTVGEMNLFFGDPNDCEINTNVGRQSGGKSTKYSYLWKDSNKNKLEIKPDKRLIHCLAAHAQSQSIVGASSSNIEVAYSVKCFTELRLPSKQGINSNQIFRATPTYRASSWFDWALIRDPSYFNHEDVGEGLYIGQLLGFFQYTTPNIRTPRYKTTMHIPTGVDTTLYCAVHAGDEFVKVTDLDTKMIVPFNMLNESKIYIVPLSSIVRPMMVVSNFGKNSQRKKLAIMPMHSWGQIFRERIIHHKKCNAPKHPTQTSWASYCQDGSYNNANTIDPDMDSDIDKLHIIPVVLVEEEDIDNGPDIHSGDEDNCSELSELNHESDDEDDSDDNDF